jgi:hypothetical protein
MYAFMRRGLASKAGHTLYRHRKRRPSRRSQIKFNRKINRFQRRDRAAALSKWRLVAATHNFVKLHSHRIAAETASDGGTRARRGPTRSRRPQRAARRENSARQPRRLACLGPTLGRRLSRPNALPAARALRDADANEGRRGRACAFAHQQSSRAPRPD